MLNYNQNKEAINEAKEMITNAHNILLKAIHDTDLITGDYDRKQLRTIRDRNIKTILLIKELEMREII